MYVHIRNCQLLTVGGKVTYAFNAPNALAAEQTIAAMQFKN